MSQCSSCGGRIELGSSITKGCKECFYEYLALRDEAEGRGEKVYPLANWVEKVKNAWKRFTERWSL